MKQNTLKDPTFECPVSKYFTSNKHTPNQLDSSNTAPNPYVPPDKSRASGASCENSACRSARAGTLIGSNVLDCSASGRVEHSYPTVLVPGLRASTGTLC